MADRASARRSRSADMDRTDIALRVVTYVLIIGVLLVAGAFGVSVYRNYQEERAATPAQRALIDLEKVVRKNPNNAAARVRYGEALASAGLFKEATTQLEAAVKIDKTHTGAWLDLGVIAMQNDERAAAEKYFTQVVELTAGSQFEDINNRREQALFHLGEIALDAKRYEDALGFFKAATRIRRDASDSYYLMAQAYRGLDQDNAALEQLDAALMFDPNYPEAHFLYGEIMLDRGDRINAAVHLRKAADLAPAAGPPQEALEKLGSAKEAIAEGRDALKAKDFDKAIDAALLARALDPESVEAAIFHAEAAQAKGDKKAVTSIIGEAKKLAEGDKAALAKIAAFEADSN